MKIEGLTVFRFIAAAIVVIFHYGPDAAGFGGILKAGPEMVTFFFVLSGFVMGISYLGRDVKMMPYWWARIARIMPIYLAALVLFVVMVYMQGGRPDNTSLVLSLTLTQAWVSPYPLALNSPGWSLSVEAFFYLSFPFILGLINKRYLSARTMMAVSLFLWALTQAITATVLSKGIYGGFPSLSHDLIYYFPLVHFCSFLLGISGAMLVVDGKVRINNEIVSLALVGITFISIIVALGNQDKISRFFGLMFAYGSSFYAPLFIVFVIAVSICKSQTMKILGARPFVSLGEASYSMYILQMPMHYIYGKHIAGILDLPPLEDFVSFFAFLTAISILSFLVFERPANRFIRYSFPSFMSKQLMAFSAGAPKGRTTDAWR
jgi:peptidoglycan/LPS O-acetylase OafA/YrhL